MHKLVLKRPSGLIWAMTMFDMRITNSLTMNEALLRQSWGKGGMIKMAMLERFGQYEWMSSDWVNGEAFNNTFLIRKPGVPTPFIQISNGKETFLNEDSVSQLHLMKKPLLKMIRSNVISVNQTKHGMPCCRLTMVECNALLIIWKRLP